MEMERWRWHTKAVHKGHLRKCMQQLDGDVTGVDMLGHQAIHVCQLAPLYPLHRQHTLPRELAPGTTAGAHSTT